MCGEGGEARRDAAQIIGMHIHQTKQKRRSAACLCFCSAAAVPADLFFLFFSFFWLTKASAAWDGETVRLLALANKDSEKRSFLSFFLTLYTIHLSFFLPHPQRDLFYTFPSGGGFKLVLQPVLRSAFVLIF